METYKLYDGEVTLAFDPGRHKYTVSDRHAGPKAILIDVPVDGVTGITGIIDKSGPISGWAVKLTVGHFEKNLKPGVPLDEVEIKDLLEDAKRVHRITKQKAGDLGTMIHEWIEKYIKWELEIKDSGEHTLKYIAEPKRPYNPKMRNAIDAFFKWRKEHKIEFYYSEKKVYSRKYRYAGTLDAEGTVDDHLSIIDFKSSNAIYPEMALQVAGYQQARQEETGIPYEERWIVRFGKDDGEFEAVKLLDFKKDIRAFLAAQKLQARIKEL
ncbi:PD-(D/E)XK nuclease family protein [Patescibacteria group bacterium]|nr:PD-(D/E)XK nuclease family protein [Patescibacteria group bacterium]